MKVKVHEHYDHWLVKRAAKMAGVFDTLDQPIALTVKNHIFYNMPKDKVPLALRRHERVHIHHSHTAWYMPVWSVIKYFRSYFKLKKIHGKQKAYRLIPEEIAAYDLMRWCSFYDPEIFDHYAEEGRLAKDFDLWYHIMRESVELEDWHSALDNIKRTGKYEYGREEDNG